MNTVESTNNAERELKIFHFNDVYEIEASN